MYLRMDVDVRAFLRFTYTHTYIHTYIHGCAWTTVSCAECRGGSFRLAKFVLVRTDDRTRGRLVARMGNGWRGRELALCCIA